MREPVVKLHMTIAFCSFLKGCSLSQSLIYGIENVSKIGPVPVFDSNGISPSPYLSFKRKCFIFREVISCGLASRSQSNAKAALFLLNCSYFMMVWSSHLSQISDSRYGLILLVLFSLIFTKEGVVQSEGSICSRSRSTLYFSLYNHLKKYFIL